MERKVYVLMFAELKGENSVQMFATATVKRQALRHARRLNAEVYAIPYPG